MKKVIAISLLLVHFFTTGGYRLVLNYFERATEKTLEHRLDLNEYNDKDLVTLKIPLHMPYVVSRNDFERCNGVINVNGVFYNYVKRKLSNDTLILQCIPNTEKNRFCRITREYAKTSGEKTSSLPGKAISILLKISYFHQYHKAGCNFLALSFNTSRHYNNADDHILCSPFILLPSKPPESN